MSNPNPKARMPTVRQFEVLKFVYFCEFSRAETADHMGISRQAVDQLIDRLCEGWPDLIVLFNPKQARPKKKLSYYVSMDYDADDDF